MKRFMALLLAASLAGGGWMVGNVIAQDGEDGGGMGGMTAFLKQTDAHKQIQKQVGEWKGTYWFRMMPGAPPMEGVGSATTTSILNGYFVQTKWKSTMMGQPFEGLGHMGYDTLAKEYVSLWMDGMTPFVLQHRGESDGKMLNLAGTEPDMMTGKMTTSRMTLAWQDDDTYTVSFYRPGPDGKEFQSGNIVYTRKP